MAQWVIVLNVPYKFFLALYSFDESHLNELCEIGKSVLLSVLHDHIGVTFIMPRKK